MIGVATDYLASFTQSEVNISLFHINSFINIPNKLITDLELVKGNPDEYFINVKDTAKLVEVYDQLDFNYLNGVIYLEYLGKPVMDYTHWDLVDQLWAYILNVIDDYFNNGIGSTYFPDQPLKFEISDYSRQFVTLSLSNGKLVSYTLPKRNFLSVLLEGAEDFYLYMIKAFSKQSDYTLEIKKIARLKELLIFLFDKYGE